MTITRICLRVLACVAGGGLMMIVLYFLLSWVMSRFVFPIAVGVFATMSVLQVGSSKHWIWHPWTWFAWKWLLA